MVRIEGTNQELKVIQQNKESVPTQNGAEVQLREVFTYEQNQDNSISKPLKAEDLDYSKFPKKNRLDASDFATRSLNEVKDKVREFNSDFPEQPYFPDYSSFPNPESFDKKKYGGSDNAYRAWKNAVTEWVEDCKQDMSAAKSANINSLTRSFERTLNQGFFNLYLQAGITRAEIQEVYEKLNGNMNDVKKALDEKANEIMKNDNRNAAKINGKMDDEATKLHKHLDYNTYDLGCCIRNEGRNTRETVREEGIETRQEIQNMKDDIMKKLEEMPTKKSLVYDFIKGTLRIPLDVAKAGFDLGSCLLGLPAGALQKIIELLS